MSLRHAILGIVEFQPIHGYEIRRVLQEGMSSFWPVNLAGIYPSLAKLEEDGLVTHRVEPSEAGRPARKVFEITPAGREEMSRWRHLPPEGQESFKSPLFLKLLFTRQENQRDSVDWINKEIEAGRARSERMRAEIEKPDLDTVFTDFMRKLGLAHTETKVELLEELRDKVLAQIDSRADDENH